MERIFPIGAELQPEGTHFRVWAPASRTAAVELESSAGRPARAVPLQAAGRGRFAGFVPGARAGDRYRFQLDGGSFPDPASRFQPEGPHGASGIVDRAFPWTDAGWKGHETRDIVIYELHLGTFTPAGTWRAAMEELPELQDLGVTTIEVMPVSDFPGRWGWGYDGVNHFAPAHIYGAPADAKAFVDRAHALGLMVILDVVYNHFGPDGNYLAHFSPDYFTRTRECEWGDAINFDGPGSEGVREFFLTNVRYWISEYHFDGLRLDATQQIYDSGEPHILEEIAAAAREAGAGRRIYVIAEDETQRARLVRDRSAGGYGLDGTWNDDFHHAAMVAATGRSEAYYLDYRGTAQEFVSAFRHGFLFQGQWYSWQHQRRGTPALDIPPSKFVLFLQNHDQVSNSARGLRLHQLTSPSRFRALTAMTLLGPGTPLLFQGQESAAAAPFHYFSDHVPELQEKVDAGRKAFVGQFSSLAAPGCAELLSRPGDPATFRSCVLEAGHRRRNPGMLRLHRDLLRLRREDPGLRGAVSFEGAVLGTNCFLLRFVTRNAEDRIVLVNLGGILFLNPAPEPLLAPLEGKGWRIAWSSEDPAYGGNGAVHPETTSYWIIPGETAFLLAPDDNARPSTAKLAEKN